MHNDILDIFYNHVIKEAQTGRVNCLSYFNILFNTEIQGEVITTANYRDDLYVPTLIIRNKALFDEYLVYYVKCALEFYDDNNFDEDILDNKVYDEIDKICKEKVILTLLWSNATSDDFRDPISFLQRRIAFIKNTQENIEDIGYCDILSSNISIQIKKDKIFNETPFLLNVSLTNGDYKYELPQVKFGLCDNKLYIYAIQNKGMEMNSYTKKMKRLLYKLDENFDRTQDNYELYGEGNLADITKSFLLVANIAVFYLKRYNIDEIVIPSILIERWNAKVIASNLRLKFDEQKQNEIQNNITQKLIRTFLRLKYHHETLEITSYPMEFDNCLHLSLHEGIICNDHILEKTALLAQPIKQHKK